MSDSFIIDSKELNTIEASFYGYAVTKQGILTRENSDIDTISKMTDGNGAYILIRKDGDKVRITQDFLGSYGIYLFRKDDDFVLSNKFWRLIDYLRGKYNLSLNINYASSYLASVCWGLSCDETLINEIIQVDRCDEIIISIARKKIEFTRIDYEENTISPTSEEGIRLIDSWYEKWVSIIRKLYKDNAYLSLDLSGGMDSRLVFMLAQNSQIDLSAVNIRTIEDDLHTHTEDYNIAKEIVNHYGQVLNRTNEFFGYGQEFSVTEVINQSFESKLGFHKQMYFPYAQNGTVMITGQGGECIRNYHDAIRDDYIEESLGSCKQYGTDDRLKICCQARVSMERAFEYISKKYNIEDISSPHLSRYFKVETLGRNHGGKQMVESYERENYRLLPLFDNMLQKLKYNDDICEDYNLIIALMYTRYGKELLSFEFDGNRRIAQATLDYAESINEKYPFIPQKYDLITRDSTLTKQKRVASTNCTQGKIDEAILALYESAEVKKAFSEVYNKEILEIITKDVNSRKFHPFTHAYSVIAIAKAAMACREQ